MSKVVWYNILKLKFNKRIKTNVSVVANSDKEEEIIKHINYRRAAADAFGFKNINKVSIVEVTYSKKIRG